MITMSVDVQGPASVERVYDAVAAACEVDADWDRDLLRAEDSETVLRLPWIEGRWVGVVVTGTRAGTLAPEAIADNVNVNFDASGIAYFRYLDALCEWLKAAGLAFSIYDWQMDEVVYESPRRERAPEGPS